MAFLTNLFTSVHGSLPSYLLQQSHSADYEYGVRGGRAKPCRACSDFQTWIQQSSKSKDGSKADDAPAKPPQQTSTTASSHKREDCPLDKDQLGRASWSLVHTMAAYYPETPTAEDRTSMGAFVRALGRFYPCESCAEDFRRDIDQHPPDTSSRTALAAWWCQAHNRVNRKLGKTEFDCSRVDERWLDGWKDGSCG
ncbi:hypothetical protein TYRP_006283 [Tyrophagus putrescentiae]|nr:hypothetical protein TYRP_006283 [Tyrophagus putrescentiae]